MIHEVSPTALPAYAAYFPGPHLTMVTAAIVAGNTVAQLWTVPQANADPIVLLFDQGNKVFYLAGELVEEAAQAALIELIGTTIRPAAVAAGVAYFKARPLSPSLTAVLPALFPWCTLREVQNLFYGVRQSTTVAIPRPAVDDLQFVQINQVLLDETIENSALIRDEVRWMWPSLARFYSHGFGVAAIIPGRALCWCTAEYVSPTRCGIGIATDEAYQGRGLATATTAHFIDLCRQQGIAPYWECGKWNGASMRVAEKAGFTKLTDELFWVGVMGASA